MDWSKIKYFTYHEFDDPSQPNSGREMNQFFVELLDQLRARTGFPLKVTSGFRTTAHNKSVGGVADSAHTKGLAADLIVADSRHRFRLVQSAIALGFKRIGIGSHFVHLDCDPSKDQEVIWLYSTDDV